MRLLVFIVNTEDILFIMVLSVTVCLNILALSPAPTGDCDWLVSI